jgi:hypothetical protein
VKLNVPWDLANFRMEMVTRILTDEGETVDLGAGPVEVRGHIEVARGLGQRHGTPLISTFVIALALPNINVGGYVFELSLDNRIIATEHFSVT